MSRQEVIARLRKIEGEEARKSAAGVPGTFRQAHKPNNVKYNTEFYGHPVEGPEWMWCVVFQWWCMKEAGVPKSVAVSGGQGNASASASEGVLKPKVCRGRPFSSAAIASRATWSS
jgi:hypothetical protein